MDKVRKYTDEQLKKLEKRLAREYSSAKKELEKKWKEYMAQVKKQLQPYEDAYDSAVKGGVKAEIADAKAALDNMKRSLTLSSPRYDEMVDNLTDRMAHVNETALAYINDKVPDLYIANHNAIAPTAQSLGIDFTLINKNTLKNVTMTRSLPLPKKLNIAKDKRWNAKKMNSSLLQGLLQGESMDKIAARMKPIVGGNQAAAIRSARTMVTQAENKGRLDSYHELEDMGTVMKKRWIATADERTRESHLLLDGEEVDLDETFSNGLMYPGDPDADDPGEVYNCRCSMETVILGFMDADGNINYIDESLREDTGHHEQIEEEISRRHEDKDTETYGSLSESLRSNYDRHAELNNLIVAKSDDIPDDFFGGDLSLLSKESEKAVEKTLVNLMTEYDTPLAKVRTMTLQESVGNSAFATTRHNYTNDTAEIIINPVKCKDSSALSERLSELMDKGYSVKTKNPLEYMPTHEFAHSLFNIKEPLKNSSNFVNANYDKIRKARKEVMSVWNDYTKKVSELSDIAKKNEMDFILNGTESSAKKAREAYRELDKIQISKYSLTNEDEFMAESFAHYKLSGVKNEYADRIGRIIDDNFKR